MIFFQSYLVSANYGSWTRVNRYTDALVISGATNDIRRLGLFDGLTFQDSATASNFSSLLPVLGNVNLNGGILTLQRDLQFEDVVDFVGEGRIYSDNEPHSVTLPAGFFEWNYSYTFRDVALFLNSDLTLNDAFTFQNTCTIDGQGKLVDLRSGGNIYVSDGATLNLKNVTLLGLEGANLRCVGDDAYIRLKNSGLVLSGLYTFSCSNFDIYQDSKITGTGVFAYMSDKDLTIHSQSKLFIDRKVTFSYDSVSASKEKLVMEDETATLHLNGCTLHSTRTGLKLQGGTVIIEDLVTIRSEAQVIAEMMELDPTLTVDVISGGIFDVDGIIG